MDQEIDETEHKPPHTDPKNLAVLDRKSIAIQSSYGMLLLTLHHHPKCEYSTSIIFHNRTRVF